VGSRTDVESDVG